MENIGPSFTSWLLGTDPRRRSAVLLSFQSTALYVIALAIIGGGVLAGLVSFAAWKALAIYDTIGVIISFLIVRIGVDIYNNSSWFGELQIAYALVSLDIAYIMAPAMREPACLTFPLILVFGAFLRNPRRSAILGWSAIILYLVAVVLSKTYEESELGVREASFHAVYAFLILPASANLSGVLGSIRNKLKRQNIALADAMEQIRVLATIDHLTGLPNRRYILDRISHEMAKTERTGTGLFACMIDIDHFKRINDTYGHNAGDTVLKQVAQIASSTLRKTDLLGRWGGEEFIVIIPDVDLTSALKVVQRISEKLSPPAPGSHILISK